MGCRKLLQIAVVILSSLPSWALAGEPEDVVFQSSLDGTEQRYVLIEPDSFANDGSGDLMIALHGHGSDRWQFATSDRDECRACRGVAKKYGMLYVSPDYRAKTSWMGPAAEADMVQIIAALKRQYRIRRVYWVGASMGGSSVLTFAALHPELVDGVASMNGTANHLEYTQFQDAIGASFGGSKKSIPEEYKKRSAEYWPERLTMPIGITAGGKDELVPPQSVNRLANVLKLLDRPVLMIYREDGGHSTNYEDAVRILEFIIKSNER
ncbi:alpha/beta fold hydrolase [bacterium]|nr:alpha/beta fold hydrolase [bacterium]